MSKRILCKGCGHPQSSPIPHEHDQTEREKAIIRHFKELNADLLEACRKLVVFTDEVLPQAGQLCFDVGNLNDALCMACALLKKASE